MKRIAAYFEEAFKELVYKVSWPTWSELQSSALVVMVASLIIALTIFGMDTISKKLMELIYGMFY